MSGRSTARAGDRRTFLTTAALGAVAVAKPVYQDYRRVLDNTDIDAVIVGTGEFQRVLPSIEACLAGKDVYAEKPLTLYMQEGRALVTAVRKHDRVLQVGSQQRSMAVNRLACEFVRTVPTRRGPSRSGRSPRAPTGRSRCVTPMASW
jgi:predicted dehydrogenase